MRRVFLLATLLFALGACSRADAPATGATPSPQQAEARLGDVVVHASAVQASALDDAFLRANGIERSDRIALLLVSVRRNDGSDAAGLPITVTAQAAPEGRALQSIALREIRVDGLMDRVGTVDIAPPEALRFEVSIRYGAATSTISFSRTFFPR